MYRPSILLPSDEYRGSIVEIGVVATGVVLEHISFLLVSSLATLFALFSVHTPKWIFVLTPLLAFDAALLLIAANRIYRNYSWLLESERRGRVFDFVGVAMRFVATLILALVFLDFFNPPVFAAFCSLWYITSFTLNLWAKSLYGWVRIHCFEFVIFLLSLKICLKLNGTIQSPWTVIFSPAWFLTISILVFGCFMWQLARDEADPDIDLVLRSFILGLILMGIFYFAFLRYFIVWLETGQGDVLLWGIPLFLGQSLSLFYAVMLAITYAAQRQNVDVVPSGPEALPRGPPILRNARIRLAKVGNNFYRLEHGLGSTLSDERTPLIVDLPPDLEAGPVVTDLPENSNLVVNPSPGCYSSSDYGTQFGEAEMLPDERALCLDSAEKICGKDNIQEGCRDTIETHNGEESQIDRQNTSQTIGNYIDRQDNFNNDAKTTSDITNDISHYTSQIHDSHIYHDAHEHDTVSPLSQRQPPEYTGTPTQIHGGSNFPQQRLPHALLWEDPSRGEANSGGAEYIQKDQDSKYSKQTENQFHNTNPPPNPSNLTTQTISDQDDGVNSEDQENCIICCQNMANALFLHCGHGGVCSECAQTCFRRTGQCPTCRQPVDGIAEFDPLVAHLGTQITAHVQDTK